MHRAGVIGLGRIGSILEGDSLREKPASHSAAIDMHGGVELVGGCDLREERRLLFEERWGVSSYGNIDEFLSEERLDILVASTPPDSHYDVVRRAAGIPVIICEKPLSNSLLSAREMLDICEQRGSVLLVNHERRFSSDYLFARAMIERGAIGALRSIRGSIFTMDGSNSLSGGGVLMDDGTHLLDAFRFFSGSEVGECSALMSGSGSGFLMGGTLRMENGVLCSLESSGKRDYFSFVIELFGDSGKIEIGNGVLNYYKSCVSKHYEGFNDLCEEEFPSFSYSPQLYNVIDAAVRHLDGDEGAILSSGLDGYRSLEIIFGLYSSVLSGGVISFPFSDLSYSDFPDLLSALDKL